MIKVNTVLPFRRFLDRGQAAMTVVITPNTVKIRAIKQSTTLSESADHLKRLHICLKIYIFWPEINLLLEHGSYRLLILIIHEEMVEYRLNIV